MVEGSDFPYEEMVEALISHDEEFLVSQASNPDCPVGLFGLLCEETKPVLLALAENPSLVDPYISHLIVMNDSDVSRTLLSNPGLQAPHLRMLLDRFPDELLAVIAHPNAPADLLEYVYHRECCDGDTGELIATAIITHKNAPVAVLMPAYRNYPTLKEEVVEALFRSGTYPGVSPVALAELLDSHPETKPLILR